MYNKSCVTDTVSPKSWVVFVVALLLLLFGLVSSFGVFCGFFVVYLGCRGFLNYFV